MPRRTKTVAALSVGLTIAAGATWGNAMASTGNSARQPELSATAQQVKKGGTDAASCVQLKSGSQPGTYLAAPGGTKGKAVPLDPKLLAKLRAAAAKAPGGGKVCFAEPGGDDRLAVLAKKLGASDDQILAALADVKVKVLAKGGTLDSEAAVQIFAHDLGIGEAKARALLATFTDQSAQSPKIAKPGVGKLQYSNDFVAQLAKKLGLSQAKVDGALKQKSPKDEAGLAKALGVGENKLKLALQGDGQVPAGPAKK
ncbi:hypothetical protein [Streptomyces sp. NPDC058964]|uniref:hypothetical protein n=1 Tax=Streptomyces sp. NPDC058964 TaxID=3346681 RepID=UPI0036843A4E